MRRLAPLLLACAAALGLAAPASAATPGVNVSRVDNNGDPYVRDPGIFVGDSSDAAASWRDVADSGARSLRTFVPWNLDQVQLDKYARFTQKAAARGLDVDLVVTGGPTNMSTPAAYARSMSTLASHLKGRVAAYEVWNEPDDTVFWRDGPKPGDYAALLRAAYKAVNAADPAAKVLVGGLVGNDAGFVSALYDHGAAGHFDGVAVHTDTACNTTDPREYYREADGHIGRWSFTGYREVHRVMAAHGDGGKPIWMSELGWSTTTAVCDTGSRAGTKPGGVSREQQADFLTKAYGCLANDDYVKQALWFNLHDFDSSAPGYDQQLGLVDDAFHRKPAFSAFASAGRVGAIPCGGALDDSAPTVSFGRPAQDTRYATSVPVAIHARDAQGVQDINLYVDGHNVPVKTLEHGRTADVKIVYRGAGALAYGPHTLVARARDEARNIGTARRTIIRVGGGAYAKVRIPSRLKVHYGAVRRRAMAVHGRVSFAGGVRGEGQVEFRFERRVKGAWRLKHLWHRTVHRPFGFTVPLQGGGQWRVRARYVPAGPFEAAVAAPKLIRAR